jgi:hypothetical protein
MEGDREEAAETEKKARREGEREETLALRITSWSFGRRRERGGWWSDWRGSVWANCRSKIIMGVKQMDGTRRPEVSVAWWGEEVAAATVGEGRNEVIEEDN